MARVAGRNSWIAVPVGMICAGVVGALVWLSLPMLPIAGAWIGQTAYTALTEPLIEPAPPAETVDVEAIRDCHDLYPEGVWAELLWRGDALLSQTASAPATAATTVVEALAPTVRLTCAWAFPSGGSVVSTLSSVGADAAAVAEAAFQGQGFTCDADATRLHCTGESASAIEDHVFQDGMWLSSIVVGWHPDDYAARVATFVLG